LKKKSRKTSKTYKLSMKV